MTTTVKTCFKCKTEKPLTDFYVHPAMGDGRLNKCKECAKSDVKANYEANFSHYQAYEHLRFKSPERKEKLIEYQRKRRESNPQKTKARNMTSNAIRDGKLLRKPCQVCGNEKSEAHHHDYSKPLDVQWLCRKHHRIEHGQLKHMKAA